MTVEHGLGILGLLVAGGVLYRHGNWDMGHWHIVISSGEHLCGTLRSRGVHEL